MVLRLIRSFRNCQKLCSVIRLNSEIRRGIEECSKQSKGLVLGLFQPENEQEEPKLTVSGEKYDDRTKGKLMELIRELKLRGKPGKGRIFHNLDEEFDAIAVVGLGRKNVGYNELENIEEGMENVRIAAGVGAKQLQDQGCTDIVVDCMDFPEQAAEGSTLAIFVYQDHKNKKFRKVVPKLDPFETPDMDNWTRGCYKAEAQNLARKLAGCPANLMTPTAFAQATMDNLCSCGITVETRTLDWLEHNNLNSFLIIARGSCEPPMMLEIAYCGGTIDEKPVLLVGKGITFNSGGLCLRHNEPEPFSENRASMSGAATIVAAIKAAAMLSLPINLIGIIPLCENMPSGMAVKPGDIVTCLNGKTVCIEDTSKAAVVMMADPLIYGQKVHKPRLVIDVATISDGIRKALGSGATGVFSSSHYIWDQFSKAGSVTGDRMWRMPLWEFFSRKVTRYLAFDISNLGDGYASACLAAAVLQEFIPCADWAHLDTRGVGMMTHYDLIPYLVPNRMSGRPTRTLVQFLYQMACPKAQPR